MLQLRLHRENSFNNDLFNFFPNLVSMFTRRRLPRFTRWLRHQSTKAVRDFQLMLIIIEIVISLVETVIRQMNVNILHIIWTFIFLGGKSNKPISVQENGHWVNDWCYQDINPEVIFVLLPQSGVLDVFLYDVAMVLVFILGLLNLVWIMWVIWLVGLGRCCVTVALCRLLWFFILKLFVLLLLLSFQVRVGTSLKFVYSFHDENTPALASSLRLHDI